MTLKELQAQLSGLESYVQKDESALRAQARAMYKPAYDADLDAIREAVTAAQAEADRSALSKGMQRSSYSQAQRGLIAGQGAKAQSQLAGTYEGNVATALQTMMDSEYDRKTAADQYRDQLLMSIYNYGASGSGGSGGYSSGGSSGAATSALTGGGTGTLASFADVLNAGTGLGASAQKTNALNALKKALPLAGLATAGWIMKNDMSANARRAANALGAVGMLTASALKKARAGG